MDVVGVTKVRGCCTFLWMQEARAPRRIVFVRPYHCAACVGEMVRSAKLQRITVSGSIPMDRVRGALAGHRADLLDRWRRQLDAAAEAGFALDPVTAEILPDMLEAADRALERRFRAVPAGTPSLTAQARRAALQSSLLGDFIFDAVLEVVPELSATEQRLVCDALAHAAVEVLVRAALAREQERRKRDAQRLARLAHDLRNSVTAMQLAADLLRRTGGLRDGRATRALQRNLARLRAGIEDSLLDEVLTAGGLRIARLRLAPVLREAHSAAAELGARDKDVQVVFEQPPRALQVEADRRVMGPAIRGLLRAGVALAHPGSVIHFGAGPARKNGHVTVSVDLARRLAGKRLPELPSLDFARRAARAHGGSVSTRMAPGDGCELRLELPRIQPQ